MARYTDIDLLIEAVEETTWYHISKQGELVKGANSKDDIPLYKHSDIKEVLNNAPTADVVPSSEIAKEFTCFVGDPHKVDHCPYLDEIEKAKSEVEKLEQAYNARLAKDIETNADFVKYAKREVAREIFEEIEKETEIGRIMNACAIVSLDAIAELKKKYTEGNDANS